MQKKMTFGCLGFFAVLVVVFVLGPRVKIDTTLQKVTLPKDVEKYVLTNESRFSDLRSGTNKKIVWFDPTKKEQTDWSVVFIHGFSASRQELDPVCIKVAQGLKANLFYTRLTGHGRSNKAMSEASVHGWLNDGVEAIEVGRRLGKKVLLVGSSTGGSLAIWLTANSEYKPDMLVVSSANFFPKNKLSRILLWPWGNVLVQLLLGSHRQWKPANKMHAKMWTHRYESKVLLPMMGLVQITNSTDVSKIKIPTLLFYSKKDKVVDSSLIEQRFPLWGSKKKELVHIEGEGPGHHVLAGDILSPGTNDKMIKHILQFAGVKKTTIDDVLGKTKKTY